MSLLHSSNRRRQTRKRQIYDGMRWLKATLIRGNGQVSFLFQSSACQPNTNSPTSKRLTSASSTTSVCSTGLHRGEIYCNLWCGLRSFQSESFGCTLSVPFTEPEHRFLFIAGWNQCVLTAILALSATHMAYQTGSAGTRRLAEQYRISALSGLTLATGDMTREASAYPRESSDAILAAQVLLSWQCASW